MLSDTFVVVFFAGMTVIGLVGMVLVNGVNKEIDRITKGIADKESSFKIGALKRSLPTSEKESKNV